CGRAALIQTVSAVSGACMVVRKDLYLRVGGLDERDLADGLDDVDFCLKLRRLGSRCVWTPHAEFSYREPIHQHPGSSAPSTACLGKELDCIRHRWGNVLQCDPAYSPNLTLEREDVSFAFPPRVDKPWRGAPSAIAERS